MWALAGNLASLNSLSQGVWGMAKHWEDACRVRLCEEALLQSMPLPPTCV